MLIPVAGGMALMTANFMLTGSGTTKTDCTSQSRLPAFPFALAAQTL